MRDNGATNTTGSSGYSTDLYQQQKTSESKKFLPHFFLLEAVRHSRPVLEPAGPLPLQVLLYLVHMVQELICYSSYFGKQQGDVLYVFIRQIPLICNQELC